MGLFRRNRQRDEERAVPTGMVRAPQLSTTIVGTGGSSIAMARGKYNPIKTTDDHYLCNVFLYRGIACLGEDLSSLTLRVGPDPDKAQDFNPKHPLALALGPSGKPNPQTTARALWKWTVAQWVINGRFAWEKDISANPITYWPLVATRLEAIPTRGGDRYFSAFDYDIGQGQKKRSPADKVVYHWRPSQHDWRLPESQLQSARLDLEVAVMQDLYDASFLRNDARPAAIVVHERIEDSDERDAFRRQFLDTHQGARNAGKTAFVEADPDGAPAKDALLIQTLGLSQKDAEFIKRYEAKINAICIATGVPRTRMGDASTRTFSNANEEMKMYWRNTVRELAVQFADAINLHVAPLYGTDLVWWDFSENPYLREQPKLTVYESIAAYQAGIITIQEARSEAMQLPEEPVGDLKPPEPGKDVNVPGDEPPNIVPPAPNPLNPPAALEPGEDAIAAQAVVGELRDLLTQIRNDLAPIPLPPVIDVEERPESAQEAQARRTRQWRAFANNTEPLEKRWEKRWQRLFDQMADSTVSRLNGKRGRQAFRAEDPDVGAIFDAAHWKRQMAQQATDMYEDITSAAFKAFEAFIGIAFDLDSPFARGYIESRVNHLAGQVVETTYEAIKAQLVAGAEAGEGIPALANRIRNLFEQTYAHRAETVARTEVISGYNGAATEAAAQTDVVTEMEWISAHDSRTREEHAAADGQRVKVGSRFQVGADSLAYPGDPSGSPENIINCRCTTAPVVGKQPKRDANVVPMDRVARLALAVHRGELRLTDTDRAMAALR